MSLTVYVAGRLRELVVAFTCPLMPAQIQLPAIDWSRFERVALILYWKLALQLEFFDEEINTFCTVWYLFTRKQSPSSSYPLASTNCLWRAAAPLQPSLGALAP